MLKFDTRDKKPKLWNVAILTLVAAVVIFFLVKAPERASLPAVNLMIVIYILGVIIFLVSAFFKQIHYNPYSYNTIYYAGFAIFLLSVFISHLVIQISMLSSVDGYQLSSLILMLKGSARNYMVISAPFVFAFSIALFISNISLVRHEGKRFVNYLGMILAVLMVAGEIVLFFADYYMSGSQAEVMTRDLIVVILSALYLYFECMIIGAIIANLISVKYEPEKDKDFIIILGCSLRKDGTPTPLLAGRVDRALDLYHKQIEKTGKVPILIPSGGKGIDELHSESKAMAEYMMSKGVPKVHILMEDKSANTYENMLFSKEKIMEINSEAKVAFSTTNYHVFRSGMMARRVKMRAVGIGSKTKWYFWPNAAVREFVGLLKQHKGKQIIIIAVMLAVYILLTIWIYN